MYILCIAICTEDLKFTNYLLLSVTFWLNKAIMKMKVFTLRCICLCKEDSLHIK